MVTDNDLKHIIPVNTSGWAIAAGYIGLFAIVVFPAPFALLFGLIALRDLKKNPTKFGKGRAWFALIMGGIGTLILLLIILSSIFSNK